MQYFLKNFSVFIQNFEKKCCNRQKNTICYYCLSKNTRRISMEDKFKKKLDSVLAGKIKIGKISMETVDGLFLLCIMILGLAVRFSLRDMETGDWTYCFSKWIDAIRQDGTIRILGQDFGSDYNPPYIYILYLISHLPILSNDLHSLKLVSILFDYLCSVAVFFTVYEITGNKNRSIFAFSTVLLAPTVFFNSAGWGQCDAIYTFFLLMSLYCMIKEKSGSSLLFMGIAFSFKIQAVFFLPFLLIMWLKNRIKTLHFLYIPLIYFLSILPMMLLGRSFKSLAGIYIGLTQVYLQLTLYYPNIYALFEYNEKAVYLGTVGIFLTIAFLGCLAYYIYRKKFRMTASFMVTLALFSISIIVYTLPHMHERYGYITDILSIIYGFTNKKRIWLTMGFQLVSLIAYIPYLFESLLIPLWIVSLFYLALIAYTGFDLFHQMQKEEIILS